MSENDKDDINKILKFRKNLIKNILEIPVFFKPILAMEKTNLKL